MFSGLRIYKESLFRGDLRIEMGLVTISGYRCIITFPAFLKLKCI